MRILNIVGAFPPAFVHGGPVYTTYHLSKALIEQGHEVFVLTTDICGEDRLDVPEHDTEWDGVPVRYCRWVKSPIPYLSPDLARQVRVRANDFDIALISSSWTGYGVMAGRECRRNGLPYIMYAHGSYAPLRLKKSGLRKKFWWSFLDKKLYNSAKMVVALTEAEVGEIHNMGVNVPIVRIPNGVDFSEFQVESFMSSTSPIDLPGLERGQRYLLFLGRFDPIKGIDLFLQGFAAIVNEFPDINIVLAGPDERGYRQKIEQLVAELEMSNRVVLPGMVTGRLKAQLLHNADAFVLTSRGEGMSIAVLEALASGIPVVLTWECGMPEVERAGAGIIVDLAVESVASGLARLLSDGSLRVEMGEHARDLALREFTWESVARKTVEICR